MWLRRAILPAEAGTHRRLIHSLFRPANAGSNGPRYTS
jgi:hypothetical protein